MPAVDNVTLNLDTEYAELTAGSVVQVPLVLIAAPPLYPVMRNTKQFS